ncbi:MAG: 50S ribosomal protein L13 [Phycisphaerae bacterium]|nr:50S ribosomal protein L13 [Phycisphaerae bacterium]
MTAVLTPKTTLARKGHTDQRWFQVNADGVVLGRLASDLAMILMGKHKPMYTPHVDVGDFVVVLNAEKVKFTGRKIEQMSHDYYTHFPGGHKIIPYEQLMAKHPQRVLELAVRRMLPKNKLGRHMLKKLKIYRGDKHNHQAQQPVALDLSNGLAEGLAKLSK